VELEAAEMLYALVRMLKPEIVVESGTGKGFSGYAMGCALRDNGRGGLITYEPNPVFFERQETVDRLSGLPVKLLMGTSLDYSGAMPCMVFVDSDKPYRANDLKRWMDAPVFLALHDAVNYSRCAGGILLPTTTGGLWVRDKR